LQGLAGQVHWGLSCVNFYYDGSTGGIRDLSLIESRDSRVIWASILLAVLCLAYFQMLDHILFSSVKFSAIFRFLLTTYDGKTAWVAAGICILAATWRYSNPALLVAEHLARHPIRVALGTVVAISLVAILVYRNYPLSMDEYSAVFQAKVFASGRLFAQLPANAIDWLVVRGFNGSFLIASPDSGRAMEAYWPSFALLLAPFEYLRIPWLCNATLAGLTILLIHWITKEIAGDRVTPGWAMLFTLASASFIAEAISLYSMTAHLTANLLFVVLMLKPTAPRMLAAGFVGSLALTLHNPLPHALFAAPWIINTALDRQQRPYLLLLGIGYLPGLMVGLGWLFLHAEIGSSSSGPASWRSIASDAFAWPSLAVVNMRIAALVKLLVWAPPGVVLLAALGGVLARENRHARLLMQSALLTFLGYFFVPFDQGHGWGYRYFHSAWAAVPILAACAMTAYSQKQPRIVAFAGAAALLSLVISMPLQMDQISQVITQHLAQLPRPLTPGNNIFFIHPKGGFYVADMVQIDPLLRDRNLTLVSRGSQLDTELVQENWPTAVKVFAGQSSDQWYLGPEDRRVTIPGSNQRQFVFKQIPSPPNAAGR
jgi:hypothetical protein